MKVLITKGIDPFSFGGVEVSIHYADKKEEAWY